MIYITGDTHGNIDFEKLRLYFGRRYVSHKDYLIILGDAGIVWSEVDCFIDLYSRLGLTVLFIDGNHENFDLLSKFPVVTYRGAKCHLLSRSIYHIIRGEVLLLNGLSFFCMGGATSIDRQWRVEGATWWKEENISEEDIRNARKNLLKVGYRVDYVLTHCAPSKVVKKMFGYQRDPNTEILQGFLAQLEFHRWYFGHYHENKEDGRFRCFYQDIEEIQMMDYGSRPIGFRCLFVKEKSENPKHQNYLYNQLSGRRTKVKEDDLPEWFYKDSIHGGRFYCLKDVKDIAFSSSSRDFDILDDSVVYLSYEKEHLKRNNLKPMNPKDWDACLTKINLPKLVLGLEKYSPDLDLSSIKTQINLVYDRHNNGPSPSFYVVRPFPEIGTLRLRNHKKGKESKYVVVKGTKVLSEFYERERAEAFISYYIAKYTDVLIFQEMDGEGDGFLKAYDVSHNVNEWVFLKRIDD